ncbi:MAG: MFS transporter [Thermodesulfobacteria bacterium]|nr:MFS transporter [Thermodesulfobacteriota bacterium]
MGKRSPLLVLSTLSTCGAFALATTAFFMPVYLKKIGFSGSQIGTLYAAFSITSIVTSFPSGLASDRFLARNLICFALVLMGIAMWIQSLVTTFFLFAAAYLAYGLGQNLFRVSLDALLLKTLPQRVGITYGIFNAMRMLGFTLGGITGGLLLGRFDFVYTLRFVGTFYFLLTSYWFFLPKNVPVKFALRTYWDDFRSPRVLFFALWLYLFYLHWGAEFTSYGLFLRENLGLSFKGMGFYMAAEFAMVGAASLINGFRLERGASLRSLATLGLFCSGLGHMGMIIEKLPVSLAFRLLHGFGDGTIMVLSYVGIAKLFKIERIGGNSGLITLSIMLGSFTGSLIFGPLGANYGYQWPLFISGAITLILIPLVHLPRFKEVESSFKKRG